MILELKEENMVRKILAFKESTIIFIFGELYTVIIVR